MTKAEEFEILLTRWEDKIRDDIGLRRRVTGEHLYRHLKSKSNMPTFVIHNTSIEISGMISGANISMSTMWYWIYKSQCPEIDGSDMILAVVHKLIDENAKWEQALDRIEFEFNGGKLPIEELGTRIDEVEVG